MFVISSCYYLVFIVKSTKLIFSLVLPPDVFIRMNRRFFSIQQHNALPMTLRQIRHQSVKCVLIVLVNSVQLIVSLHEQGPNCLDAGKTMSPPTTISVLSGD